SRSISVRTTSWCTPRAVSVAAREARSAGTPYGPRRSLGSGPSPRAEYQVSSTCPSSVRVASPTPQARREVSVMALAYVGAPDSSSDPGGARVADEEHRDHPGEEEPRDGQEQRLGHRSGVLPGELGGHRGALGTHPRRGRLDPPVHQGGQSRGTEHRSHLPRRVIYTRSRPRGGQG